MVFIDFTWTELFGRDFTTTRDNCRNNVKEKEKNNRIMDNDKIIGKLVSNFLQKSRNSNYE